MNYTVTVSLIYIKLQQTNASTQNLPFHSDSGSPTRLPKARPLQAALGGDPGQGAVQEAAPYSPPPLASGGVS